MSVPRSVRMLAALAAPLMVAVMAVSAVVAPVAVAGATTATTATTGSNPIQHVIVVMQSGHSFDNYFGTRPNVVGIPAKVCDPVAVGSATCVSPFHLSSDQARDGLSDTLHATQKAIDGGKMDGFVKAQPNTAIGSVAMGYLDGSDLPYYWNLADRFTLFDQFYAGSQAGALPNRLIAVSGQTAGVTTGTPPSAGIDVPTVFNQLDTAHLSWKYYVQGYQPSTSPTTAEEIRTPLLDMPSVTGSAATASHIVNTSQYFTDLAKGRLPAVSYVSASVDSERSPQNPAQGEAFVQSLVNALMQSSDWKHTALLVTYDDAGGWYDSAVPPTVDGAQLGLRVPAILVSPYARAGYVDSNQLDTASIPAMIESVFHLPQLTAEEASAGSILTAVNVHQTPISPAIGPSQGGAAVIVRPSVGTIYFLYLVALVLVGLLIYLAFRRHRRVAVASGPAAPPASAPWSDRLPTLASLRRSGTSGEDGTGPPDADSVEPLVDREEDEETEEPAEEESDAPLVSQPTGSGEDPEVSGGNEPNVAAPEASSEPTESEPDPAPRRSDAIDAVVVASSASTSGTGTHGSSSNGTAANGKTVNGRATKTANGKAANGKTTNGKAAGASKSAAGKAQRPAKAQGSKRATKPNGAEPASASDLLK